MVALAYAPTPADLDETGVTVVVVTPRITSPCSPSCGDSNVRDLGGYYECATCGAGWG